MHMVPCKNAHLSTLTVLYILAAVSSMIQTNLRLRNRFARDAAAQQSPRIAVQAPEFFTC